MLARNYIWGCVRKTNVATRWVIQIMEPRICRTPNEKRSRRISSTSWCYSTNAARWAGRHCRTRVALATRGIPPLALCCPVRNSTWIATKINKNTVRRVTRLRILKTRHSVTLRNPSITPPARSQRGCSTIGNVLAVSHFRVATGGNKQKSYYRQKMFHSKPYLSRL